MNALKNNNSTINYGFTGATQAGCSSGGPIQGVGNLYRSRVSGSLTFNTPSGTSPQFNFDLQGATTYMDFSHGGKTLRVNGAGCSLNNPNGPC